LQMRAGQNLRLLAWISACGRSLVVKPQPSKLMMRVRFPPPAFFSQQGFSAQSPCCDWH
jgi:hypothetical protein